MLDATEDRLSRRLGWQFFAWVATAGYSLLIVLLGNPDYLTNDDLAIQAIADGSLTGEPERTLVFPSQYLGEITRLLYLNFPNHFWYQNLLMLTYILSFGFASFILGGSEGGRQLWLVIFLGFFPLMASNPNFTTAAISASGVAALSLSLNVALRRFSLSSIPILLLLVLGLSWRPIVGGIVALLALFLGFALSKLLHPSPRLFDSSRLHPATWLYPPAVVSLFAGILYIPQSDLPLNPDHEWGAFFSYNRVRSGSIDYLNASKRFVGEPSLNSNPHAGRFNSWLGFDSDLFGLEALPQTLDGAQTGAEASSIAHAIDYMNNRFSSFIASVINTEFAVLATYFLVAVLAFVLLSRGNEDSMRGLQVAGKFAGPSLILLLGFSFFRLTTAIVMASFFVVLFGFALVMTVAKSQSLSNCMNSPSSAIRLKRPTVARPKIDKLLQPRHAVEKELIFVLVALGFWAPMHWLSSNEKIAPGQFLKREESQLQEFWEWSNYEISNRENYISGPGISTSLYSSLPWSPNRTYAPANVIPGGWLTMSPYWFQRLDRLSLEPRQLDEALIGGSLNFLGTEDDARKIATSLNEIGYGPISPQLVSTSVFENSIGVFSFVSTRGAEGALP